MSRIIKTRLERLETDAAPDRLAVVVVGPDETPEAAEARYFAKRQQDRARARIVHVYTGVPRSEAYA